MANIPDKEKNIRLEDIPKIEQKGDRFFLINGNTKNNDSNGKRKEQKPIDIEKLTKEVDKLDEWKDNLKLDDKWQEIKKKIIKSNSIVFSSSGSDSNTIFIDYKDTASLSYDSYDNEIELNLYSGSFYRDTILEYELEHNITLLRDIQFFDIETIKDIENNKEIEAEHKNNIIKLIRKKYNEFADWLKTLKDIWNMIFENLPITEIELNESGLGKILIAQIDVNNPRKAFIINQKKKMLKLNKKSLLLSKIKEQKFNAQIFGAVNKFLK